jgi:hypothetical protein
MCDPVENMSLSTLLSDLPDFTSLATLLGGSAPPHLVQFSDTDCSLSDESPCTHKTSYPKKESARKGKWIVRFYLQLVHGFLIISNELDCNSLKKKRMQIK